MNYLISAHEDSFDDVRIANNANKDTMNYSLRIFINDLSVLLGFLLICYELYLCFC